MSTNYNCPKCGTMAFASVFLLPGEDPPADVKLRRYLRERLSAADLEKLDPDFHGPCGRCLFDEAVRLGLISEKVEAVLKEAAPPGRTMEIEIF